MRRLLMILLACLALLPSLAMPARAAPQDAMRHAGCPMHGSHDEHCADHGCLGCSIEAEPVGFVVTAPRRRLLAVVAAEPAIPTHHRPGFDPPPPRADG